MKSSIQSPELLAGSISALREAEPATRWIDVVKERVRSTQFGVVQIVIHDSRVVQIDHTERTRFEGPRAGSRGE